MIRHYRPLGPLPQRILCTRITGCSPQPVHEPLVLQADPPDPDLLHALGKNASMCAILALGVLRSPSRMRAAGGSTWCWRMTEPVPARLRPAPATPAAPVATASTPLAGITATGRKTPPPLSPLPSVAVLRCCCSSSLGR